MPQLVELSCAWMVSGMVALSTINIMCLERRFPTVSQNQIYATNIAQAALDDARSVPYNVLASNIGSFSLQLTSDTAPTSEAPFAQRPIFRDCSTMAYTTNAINNGFDSLKASASETIAQLEPGVLQVTVNVHWLEQGGSRQMTMCTTIAQNGIHG